MENSKNYYVKEINYLIAICADGEKGYQKAAEITDDLELKRLFLKFSARRNEFFTELQSIIISLGSSPEKEGGMVGALHRAWIEVKEAFNNHEPQALLESCERGEKAAIEAYKNFLIEEENFKTLSQSSTINHNYSSNYNPSEPNYTSSFAPFSQTDVSLISGDATLNELPQDAPPLDAGLEVNGYDPIKESTEKEIKDIVQIQYDEIVKDLNTIIILRERKKV